MSLFKQDYDLERLVERCKRQDSAAWAELVRRFQSLVYSTARRYRLNDEDANDVFITTFQALLRSLDRIESAQTLPKWLAVTASRECLRIKRIQGRTFNPEDQGFTLDDIVATEESSAEENALAAVESEELRSAILGLAERCRKLLTLLYIEEDVSYQEISESLGMPVGAIGPTRARCLDKLRRQLQASGFFDDNVSEATLTRS
jgi:RNA polymerase sigma factor (sigma-70 family)